MTTKPATDPHAVLLPGMAIIALWMLVLCLIGLFGIMTHHFPVFVIVFCAMYAVAAHGLLKLRRWGWALSLAAAFLSMSYGVYVLFRFHQTPAVVMAVVNFVFFLYLVRPEVISRLR
jgi:uncharacterized membrane protein (DUF2068 family)